MNRSRSLMIALMVGTASLAGCGNSDDTGLGLGDDGGTEGSVSIDASQGSPDGTVSRREMS
jgi:predicted small secreted protein